MWIFKKKREALPAAEVCVRLPPEPPLTPEERRKKLILDIECDVRYAINELEEDTKTEVFHLMVPQWFSDAVKEKIKKLEESVNNELY